MLDDDQYIKIDAIIAKLKVKLGIPSSSIDGGNRIWKYQELRIDSDGQGST